MRHFFKVVLFIMSLASTDANAEPERFEINTELMEATFRILGPSAKKAGELSGGTVFILGKPIDNEKASFVLVTAAHVLDDISGDVATISFRWKSADGTINEQNYEKKIREKGTPLYIKHPSVDVAVMYTQMPSEFTAKLLPIGLLVTDETLKKYEIHPGDELICLGYPLFATGPYGYPILRSGKIASHPLVPSKDSKNWLFDFRIFPGNSGGPVYFADRNRIYGGKVQLGETLQFLAGLITAQVSSNIFKDKDLSLGVVIPAVFIKEALDLLPAKSPYP
ncbi:serine protease [Bradyrhizobium sp. JYMT SZCCT0428]|uniref:S1 family peptidase n=1 Tax=Bradyrhizobium sp. JYMT SZCCT0428 TaxID=2807673 RepID=UPI001BAAFB07|nr:serine protease [Bradyrhizobium sp. JYMT SZCCT0428]MBR1155704.1 trypsin-like peptidase domain-containing protein [Bradyrhizobium sp. JYMT SZCCT0428]